MVTVVEIDIISSLIFPKEIFPVTNLTNGALGYSSIQCHYYLQTNTKLKVHVGR